MHDAPSPAPLSRLSPLSLFSPPPLSFPLILSFSTHVSLRRALSPFPLSVYVSHSCCLCSVSDPKSYSMRFSCARWKQVSQPAVVCDTLRRLYHRGVQELLPRHVCTAFLATLDFFFSEASHGRGRTSGPKGFWCSGWLSSSSGELPVCLKYNDFTSIILFSGYKA